MHIEELLSATVDLVNAFPAPEPEVRTELWVSYDGKTWQEFPMDGNAGDTPVVVSDGVKAMFRYGRRLVLRRGQVAPVVTEALW